MSEQKGERSPRKSSATFAHDLKKNSEGIKNRHPRFYDQEMLCRCALLQLNFVSARW
jgi:hypothetical protein